MNRPRVSYRTLICTALLGAMATFRAPADPVTERDRAEKSYTGTVVSVEPGSRVFTIKGGPFSTKLFSIGDPCAFTFLYDNLKNNDRPINNLRPGEEAKVSYVNWQGMRIAHRIEQQPMQFSGRIQEIDPGKHTLTVHRGIRNRHFDIAVECITVLPGERAGTLADLHPGDPVTVTYETPGGRPAAWQVTKRR